MDPREIDMLLSYWRGCPRDYAVKLLRETGKTAVELLKEYEEPKNYD